MTLKPEDAERIFKERKMQPAKKPTKKIIGFLTSKGKVFAMPREQAETRIWFQRPVPPPLNGVELMRDGNDGNSNLKPPPLKPLFKSSSLRVEIQSATGLHNFLDWYMR